MHSTPEFFCYARRFLHHGFFVDANKFQANHVKVVTENGVVYLLGLVKHKEGDDAVEIASTTSGVTKVVKMFEYID